MSIKHLDITDLAMATAVLALQRQAYRVEAEWLGRDDIPPLNEDTHDLQACGETFFGTVADGTLVGVISYKLVADTLDLHRLMVHPEHFRRGIARALVGFVEARESQARRAIVSTGSGNLPARRFYRRLGFQQTGEREPAPGLWIVTLEKARG